MSQQIQITGGAKVRNLEGVLTGTAGVVNALGINVANGIPKLDGSGKILVAQLPNSVMEYKGTWNAATNTPTLANGTGNQGDVYLCSTAGTVNFGAGAIIFAVGDQVIYSGTIWEKAGGSTGTVTSVAVTESGDALTITGSPITTSGTINIGFAGTTAQYVNGAGGLTTFPTLTGYVPYTGATANVNLGSYSLTAADLVINHASGSGVAASITKGGNGEALTVVKSSGSGNAASITGGVTLLDELHLTTDLADAYIASAANWNSAYTNRITSATTPLSIASNVISISLANSTTNGYLSSTDWNTFNNKQTALSGTGFVKISGTTISYDNSTYLTTSSAASTYVPYSGATANLNLGTFGLTVGGISSGGILVSQSAAVSASSGNTAINGTTNGIIISTTAGFNTFTFPSSGSRAFTFPSSAGTIALTSDIPTVAGVYLPLAGGTMTGTLNGTRGSFSQSSSLTTLYGYNGNTGGTGIEGSAGNGIAAYFSNNSTTYPLIDLVSLSATKFIKATNGSAVEVFNISSSGGGYFAGNVGIGTTSPSYLLDVAGTGRFVGSLTASGVTIGDSDVRSSSGTLTLGGSGEAIRINSSGNVGIGTTAPISGGGLSKWLTLDGTYYGGGFISSVNGTAKSYMYYDNLINCHAIQGAAGVAVMIATDNTERMRITSGGEVLMNTSSVYSSNHTLQIATKSSGGILIRDVSGNGVFQLFQISNGTVVGSITHNTVNTSFNTSSDYRLKEDLKDYNGLDLISAIKTYDYQWKSNKSRMYGVMAHELAEVIPYAVHGAKDGEQMQGVDYSKIVPVLVKAIQELKAEIDELKK